MASQISRLYESWREEEGVANLKAVRELTRRRLARRVCLKIAIGDAGGGVKVRFFD